MLYQYLFLNLFLPLVFYNTLRLRRLKLIVQAQLTNYHILKAYLLMDYFSPAPITEIPHKIKKMVYRLQVMIATWNLEEAWNILFCFYKFIFAKVFVALMIIIKLRLLKDHLAFFTFSGFDYGVFQAIRAFETSSIMNLTFDNFIAFLGVFRFTFSTFLIFKHLSVYYIIIDWLTVLTN